MVIPDAVVASALSVGGTVFVGLIGLKVYHRNGRKNGGCPSPMQRLHGERIAAVEAELKAIRGDVRDIKTGMREVLMRLPKE